jgi:hypothetical protein
MPIWNGPGSIGEAPLAKKIAALRIELLEDIPSLGSLQASDLEIELAPHEKSIRLIAVLHENDQSVLAYANTGTSVVDLFQLDIKRVKDDQSRIKGRIIAAQSPATDPYACPDIVSARKRLNKTRSGRSALVWTAPEATQLPMFVAPKYMPNGQMQTVSIKVKEMHPKWVRVALNEDLVFQTSVVRDCNKGRILKLFRTQEHCSIKSGHRLQICMDTGEPITIKATIALFWEDGEISHLELLSFDTEEDVEIS